MTTSIDLAMLCRLEPLRALGPESRQRLPELCTRHAATRGENLLHPEWQGKVAYALRGEIKLERSPGLVEVVVGGSGRGLWPIWHDGKFPVAAKTITPAEMLLIDGDALDVMVTWDQMTNDGSCCDEPNAVAGTASCACSNSDGQKNGGDGAVDSWQRIAGALSLQSFSGGAFANLPTANIQALLNRFERIEVTRGNEIILQGAPGDFYYLIERGRCRVTRSVGGVPVELAELHEGNAFGEEALVADAVRNATVTMKTDGVLRRLAKADFESLLKEPLLHRVCATEAQKLVTAGAIWLDVRFSAEFQHDGIRGAINIPLNEIRQAACMLDPAPDYIVYCQTGRRSSAAAFLLSQRGIRAHLLEGGLKAVTEHQEQTA
jgi:rhodanese-related sulfurtransferase